MAIELGDVFESTKPNEHPFWEGTCRRDNRQLFPMSLDSINQQTTTQILPEDLPN